MSYDVKDKVVLVTGANRGIGKVIVDFLVKEGVAKVYAAVRKLESANSLVEAHGSKVKPIELDLSNPSTIHAAAEVTQDVQVVINNAGVLRNSTPLDKDAIESLTFEINVNVFGLIHMAQAFAPILKKNGGGAFVQLNSIASIKTFPNIATYSASKAASYSITQALNELLKEQNTLVLSVHPGPIATDMADSAGITEMAEPPSLVAEGIIQALKNGSFHAYCGSLAKNIGSAYQSFATSIVETSISEG